MYDEYLAHYGVKGMKWGRRKRLAMIRGEKERRNKLVSKEYLDALRSNTSAREYKDRLNKLYTYRQRNTSGDKRASANSPKLSSKSAVNLETKRNKQTAPGNYAKRQRYHSDRKKVGYTAWWKSTMTRDRADWGLLTPKSEKGKNFVEKKKRPTGRIRKSSGMGKSIKTHGKKLRTGKVGRIK